MSGIPGMQHVEELPTEENRLRRVWWTCNAGHIGGTNVGQAIVCADCCHGGTLAGSLACTRCGSTANSGPTRGPQWIDA